MYKIFFSFVFIFVFNFFTFGDSWRVVDFSYSDGPFPIDHSLGEFPEGVYTISCEFLVLPDFISDLGSMVGPNLNSSQGAGSVIGYVTDFFPSIRNFNSSTGSGYFETRFTLSDSQSLPVFLSVYVPACSSGVIHIHRDPIGEGTEPVPPGGDPDNPGTGGGGTTDPDNPGTGGGGTTDPDNPTDPDDPDNPNNPGNPTDPDNPGSGGSGGGSGSGTQDVNVVNPVDVNWGDHPGDVSSLGDLPEFPIDLEDKFSARPSFNKGTWSWLSFPIPYWNGRLLANVSIKPFSGIINNWRSIASLVRNLCRFVLTIFMMIVMIRLFRKNS